MGVPNIIALRTEDERRLTAHLMRLCPADRSLRFSAGLVADETIGRYVTGIRFGSDALFGLIDSHGAVVGLAHGCVYAAADAHWRIEAAFSVDAEWCRLGFGTCLMQAVAEFAKDRNADAVVGICASRNLPMRRIFERAGMTMSREDDEIHAFGQVSHRETKMISTARI